MTAAGSLGCAGHSRPSAPRTCADALRLLHDDLGASFRHTAWIAGLTGKHGTAAGLRAAYQQCQRPGTQPLFSDVDTHRLVTYAALLDQFSAAVGPVAVSTVQRAALRQDQPADVCRLLRSWQRAQSQLDGPAFTLAALWAWQALADRGALDGTAGGPATLDDLASLLDQAFALLVGQPADVVDTAATLTRDGTDRSAVSVLRTARALTTR